MSAAETGGETISRTEHLREQHRELTKITKAINHRVMKELTPDNAKEIRRAVSELMGILRIHLSVEDKALYPRLMESSDPKTRRTAEQFAAEMGDLMAKADAATGKWKPDYIISDPHFRTEWSNLSEDLLARIERENNVLYKMAEGIG